MRLIDLSEVINEIERFKGYLDEDMILRIKIAINRLPTIEAEPTKHGEWLIHECFGAKDMTCSSCGWLYEYYAGLEEEWNYCPHCGARMDEDEISNIARESADKISKALEKVRAKGMQKQNIKEDDEP